MSRSISWFQNSSPRECEKKTKEYQNKMFPFGEVQKHAEITLLHQLVPGKWKNQDLVYQLLCVKECLWEEEEYQQDELNLWKKSPLTGRLSSDEQKMLISLAKLEQGCQSIDEFPTKEQVLNYIKDGSVSYP